MSSDFVFEPKDLICIAPAIALFLGSLIPITVKVLRGNQEVNSVAALLLACLGVVCSIGSASLLFSEQMTPYFAFSKALVFDGVSVIAAIVIAMVAAVGAILGREHKATSGEHYSEYLFLLLNSAAGMMIMVWANDLIVTFIAIEIMSLCLYLLIALSREQTFSKESAFKYFVLGSFASAIFLYGVAFIYGTAGTTYISELTEVAPKLITENYLFLFGLVLTALGFCFKAAIAPFHAWTPDVYEGAPTPITAFMATGVKLVTFMAFIRFLRGSYFTTEISDQFVTLMQWLAVLTMTIGNVAAIMQNNLKRMLAYSSIAHGGYVLIGVVASISGAEGWRGDLGVFYYVIAYAVMTIGAFGVVCLLEKNEGDIVLVEDLRGLGKRYEFTPLALTLFLLSLAGIPPLVGFFGKFFIFTAAIENGLFWLVFWAAINSVVSAYYYLRPIVLMYMRDEQGAEIAEHYKSTQLVVFLMAFLVVALGLATQPMFKHVKQAINSLL